MQAPGSRAFSAGMRSLRHSGCHAWTLTPPAYLSAAWCLPDCAAAGRAFAQKFARIRGRAPGPRALPPGSRPPRARRRLRAPPTCARRRARAGARRTARRRANRASARCCASRRCSAAWPICRPRTSCCCSACRRSASRRPARRPSSACCGCAPRRPPPQCVQEIGVMAAGVQAEHRLLRVRCRAAPPRAAPLRNVRPVASHASMPAVHCGASGPRAGAAAAGHASEWHVTPKVICHSL